MSEGLDAIIQSSLLKNLANICILVDQKEEALLVLRQAIQHLPQNPLLWFRYGELCYQLFYERWQPSELSPFSLLRDNLMSVTPVHPNSASENMPYLKFVKHSWVIYREALMAFSTVIELFSQRNENTSSVYYASILRKAVILLDQKEMDACIQLCETALTSLRSVSSYDDDDIPTSKESIEYVLMLYLAECYMHRREFQVSVLLGWQVEREGGDCPGDTSSRLSCGGCGGGEGPQHA